MSTRCVCYVRTAVNVNYNKIVTFVFLQTLFLWRFFSSSAQQPLYDFDSMIQFRNDSHFHWTIIFGTHLFVRRIWTHGVRFLVTSSFIYLWNYKFLHESPNAFKKTKTRWNCQMFGKSFHDCQLESFALSEHIEFQPKSTCFSTHIRVFGKLCSRFCESNFNFWIKLIFFTRNLSRNPLNRFYQWRLYPYAADLRSIIKYSVFVFTAPVILLI